MKRCEQRGGAQIKIHWGRQASISVQPYGQTCLTQLLTACLLEFNWRPVTNRAVQINTIQRGILTRLKRLPRTLVFGGLDFEGTNNALCHWIIVGIAFRLCRWLKGRLKKTLSIANGEILCVVVALTTNSPNFLTTPPGSGNLNVSAGEDSDVTSAHLNKQVTVNVQTGSLVLFPSSTTHCTAPFHSEEQRIVLAFDVIRK